MDTAITFSEKSVTENYIFVSLNISKKKICLQGARHLENNGIVRFEISCRPDF